MDDQNKNLILATALSFLVILTWFILFPPEEQAPGATGPDGQPIAEQSVADPMAPSGDGSLIPAQDATTPVEPVEQAFVLETAEERGRDVRAAHRCDVSCMCGSDGN